MEAFGIAFLRVLVLVVSLTGLFSLIIPGVPGLVVIWAAVLVYGIITHFGVWWIWLIFVVISALMLAGNLIDNVIMGAQAYDKGASWWAIGLAMVAGVAAGFFLTPIGGLLVTLAVLFIIEFIRLKNWREALNSTGGMALGFGQAFLVRFGIGTVMIGLWLIWAYAA